MFQFALVYSGNPLFNPPRQTHVALYPADRKQTIQSQPIPEPSKGFVQARVEAAAFNPVDYKVFISLDGLP
jgi:hypothetical protein